MSKPNAKQRKFCERYIIDYNATQAYKEAYGGVKNDNVAAVNGARLLRNANIQGYLKELETNISQTIGVSKIRILLELKKIAFSSIADFRDDWITRKEFDELTPEQKACIAEIDTKIRREYDYNPKTDRKDIPVDVEYVRIKLYDKQKALESIFKFSGFEPVKKIGINMDLNRLTDEDLDKIIESLKKSANAKES